MLRDKWDAPLYKMFGHQSAPVKSTWGIEIEMEGRGLPQAPDGWDTRDEGSLRHGVEYVFSRAANSPLATKKLKIFEEEITSLIKQKLCIVDMASPRTSVHIHRNAYLTKNIDVLGVFVLFTALEPLILRLCGQARDGNNFCLPSYDCGDHVNTIRQSLNQGYLFGRGKYAALNSSSLTERGSLEFRIFPFTYQADKILHWMGWIDRMFNAVEAEEDKTFMSLIERMSGSPVYFAQHILDENLRGYKDPTSAEMLLQMGIESAYECANALEQAKELIYANPPR